MKSVFIHEGRKLLPRPGQSLWSILFFRENFASLDFGVYLNSAP